MLTNKKKKVCVVITARPSYSRVRSFLKAVKENNLLELQLVLAGPALLERYGDITNYVMEDGYNITQKVYSVVDGENNTAMSKTAGLGVMELSEVFNNLRPNVVITIADRFETISTAIAASYQNIPLGHIQGGEVTGNIDEKVRHAVTKLSDIHFVSSEDAKKRVLRLGEDPNFVFNTGCPSIDIAKSIYKEKLDIDPYSIYGGVGNRPDLSKGFIVGMQHPVTNEYSLSRQHITQTLNAVKDLDIPCLWFWPNIDAGADGTSTGIRHFRETEDVKNMHFFKNMRPVDFLSVLNKSVCLVGNSSVGIRECSYLGIPAVNIGSRQKGRARGINVVDVKNDLNKIKAAIKIQIHKKRYEQDFTYGHANAGLKIANIIASKDIPFHKKINY